jgi:hypothetical protein
MTRTGLHNVAARWRVFNLAFLGPLEAGVSSPYSGSRAT